MASMPRLRRHKTLRNVFKILDKDHKLICRTALAFKVMVAVKNPLVEAAHIVVLEYQLKDGKWQPYRRLYQFPARKWVMNGWRSFYYRDKNGWYGVPADDDIDLAIEEQLCTSPR